MNLDQYKLEDFLTDESFQSWVLSTNAEDIEFWEYWIYNNPEKRDVISEAKKTVLSLTVKEKQKLSVEHIERVVEKIQPLLSKGSEKEPKKKRKTITLSYYRVAAIIALLIASSVVFFELNSIEDRVSEEQKTSALIERETPLGQKLTVSLKDGTVIKLNSGSKLKFPSQFEADSRIVYLEGEAFFEVSKDPRRPFTVVTEDLDVTVLGTSFNINSFKHDANCQVAVATGKVKVEVNGSYNHKLKPVFLTPNEMVVFGREENILRKQNFDADEELAWKDGILYFKDESMLSIAGQLERWYDVEIAIDKSIDSFETYTGTFKNESLRNILEAIKYAKGAEYKIEKNKVFMFKKGGPI